jgi:hypothetical protein
MTTIASTKPHTASSVTNVRYDVMGLGHDAYRDLLTILGGPCVLQIVGWCDLVVDGATRCALVVTQAWPFLPLSTDPAPIKKAKRWAALVPIDHGFCIVEVPAPPSTQSPRMEAAP